MSLVIDLASSKRDPGLWRYDSALLDNLDVVRLITEEIEERRKKMPTLDKAAQVYC